MSTSRLELALEKLSVKYVVVMLSFDERLPEKNQLRADWKVSQPTNNVTFSLQYNIICLQKYIHNLS